MSRARPRPLSGDRSNAVMVGIIGGSAVALCPVGRRTAGPEFDKAAGIRPAANDSGPDRLRVNSPVRWAAAAQLRVRPPRASVGWTPGAAGNAVAWRRAPADLQSVSLQVQGKDTHASAAT